MTRSKFLAIGGLVLSLICSSTQHINAQDEDLSRKITQFLGDNAVNYIQPAVSVFSANLNSGLYHTAEVHGFLGFEVGLVVMAAPVQDNKKTFRAVLPDTVHTYVVDRDYDKFVMTSTALGSKGTKVYYRQATPGTPPIYEFPGGIDLKVVPIVAPQLNVGLPLGTEFMFRYVPEVKISDEVGKLKLLGVGLRHSLSQWLPGPTLSGSPKAGEFPLDISLGFMYQEFTLKDSGGGDFIKTKVFSAGVQASKSLFILTLYGGLAYETATTNISYVYRPTTGFDVRVRPFSVKLDEIKGDNNFRITGGLKIHLVFLDIFADYSVASQPVASAGVVLTFR